VGTIHPKKLLNSILKNLAKNAECGQNLGTGDTKKRTKYI